MPPDPPPPCRPGASGERTAREAGPPPRFDIRELGDIVYESRGAGEAEVSVVIPLYNYAKTIGEALESVVAQDLAPLATVVIDDCSTDDGGQEAIAFLESHATRFTTARVVRHRRNQGLSMARNSGIAWSDEPFLFMLDADNRLRSPALSRLLDALPVPAPPSPTRNCGCSATRKGSASPISGNPGVSRPPTTSTRWR